MLSSEQVLKVIDSLGNPQSVQGLSAAYRRFTVRPDGQSAITPNQSAFLTAASAATATAPAGHYSHPGDVETGRHRRVRGDKPLSPSELARLQRVPSDPALVPYDDAVWLLSLNRAVADVDDRALITSIASPVKEFHDGKQAEVDIQNARRPIVAAPHEALAALADSVAAENSQMQPADAIGRANRMLQENTDRRQQSQYDLQTSAQARLTAVQTAAINRMAVTR